MRNAGETCRCVGVRLACRVGLCAALAAATVRSIGSARFREWRQREVLVRNLSLISPCWDCSEDSTALDSHSPLHRNETPWHIVMNDFEVVRFDSNQLSVSQLDGPSIVVFTPPYGSSNNTIVAGCLY